MSEPMNNQSAGGQEKTFTQEDVNRIVQERLSKERNRNNSELEASFEQREKDLKAREFMMTARESISKAGLPANLLDALDKSSPEAFQKALDIVAPMFKKEERPDNGYPRFTVPMGTGNSCAGDRFRQAFGLDRKG